MTHDPREALKTAISHIEHMAAWITATKIDTYSFENLGEDMPGLREAALTASPGEQKPCGWQFCCPDGKWIGCDEPPANELRDEPEKFRRVYLSPPPAAGWGEAIEAVQKIAKDLKDICVREGLSGEWVANSILESIEDVKSLRREAPAPEGVASIVTCCVTGAIPGDGGACGDCDPCIMGEASVPEAVKRLIAEKNSLIQRIGELEDASGPDAGGGVRLPHGYALVPTKPTPAMIEAGCEQNPTQWNEGTDLGFAADVANDVYVAMVSAAALSNPPAAVESNASVELEDARAEAADSLRTLDAIAEYVGCPQDEELTVDHVRQHYMKLENAAQRQGIEDAGRIANAQAYANAEARLRGTVLDVLSGVAPAVENLACHQEQADMDGCMVKVSRQALDEVLAAVNEVAIQAATALSVVGDEAKKSEGGTEGRAGRPWPSPKPDAANDEAMASLDRSSPVAGVEPGPSDPTAERREIVARIEARAQAYDSSAGALYLGAVVAKELRAILAALDGGAGA